MDFPYGIFLLGAHLERLANSTLHQAALNVGTQLRVSCKHLTTMAACRFKLALWFALQTSRGWLLMHSRFLVYLHLKEVSELLKAKSSISICIDSAHNCEHFRLNQVVAKSSEEVLQVDNVDRAFIVAIDSTERREWRVVWPHA